MLQQIYQDRDPIIDKRWAATNLNSTGIALSIALAASMAAGIAIYGQQTATINNLSSELAEKSAQVDQQQQTIDDYASLVAAQREELVEKTTKLEALQTKISSLSQEIESQGGQIAELSAQATSLELQISALQSELQTKDRDLARILLEKESAKRVHVAHYGLGVDENDKGIVFPIEVEIIGSGDGRISVNVSDVQFETTFQDAVRTAAAVASEYTGVSLSDKDIIITLVNDSDSLIKVDGPSAGAVLAAMIAAGLQEKQLDPSVLVTGTIRSDGTIGTVGGISGKADAAVTFGATKLLVPSRQEFADSRIVIEGVVDMKQLASRMISG